MRNLQKMTIHHPSLDEFWQFAQKARLHGFCTSFNCIFLNPETSRWLRVVPGNGGTFGCLASCSELVSGREQLSKALISGPGIHRSSSHITPSLSFFYTSFYSTCLTVTPSICLTPFYKQFVYTTLIHWHIIISPSSIPFPIHPPTSSPWEWDGARLETGKSEKWCVPI